ncbi:mannose-1-phosphate guanylyltransferase/mannose-6-phosphate isomerase [Paraburkholderia terrae]|uniref:mannose-1-phosphate guanylyltransferase/mannose-6-phosphate isomerase n=1 Tax=Paraburkholderia terrae TaxID=311230 RepID=UPI00296AE9BB|nr:mannose-1-phosphate guanylyltransferase/mannose-6-phosphate isomerase [Paraburkholderia terrae]MDW3655387.1 mannose-1-phosphate guanylyltransferase/mannose-6-phosphate isomerase [Paraburkholderia terrae]
MHSVILSGGSGTRLWPISREQSPKQLIAFLNDDSLLQSTVQRLDGIKSNVQLDQTLIVVCNEEHRFTTAEQLRTCGKPYRLMLEPVAKNTAPALTVAALSIVDGNTDGIMVVMPADHTFGDLSRFQEAVRTGAAYAEKGDIVALGVVPVRPDSGYGYIRIGRSLSDDSGTDVRLLDGFVEKPTSEVAKQYVASGKYWWNSGIFIMRASVWLKAIKHYQPEIHAACEAAYASGTTDGDFFRLNCDAFSSSPSDSIDYAVLEKLGQGDSTFVSIVVPVEAGWSDLGSWDAISKIMPKDLADNANSGRGRAMFEGATSTFVHSEGRFVACVGTHDLVVVETPDAVLVADASSVQNVKAVVGRMRDEASALAISHRKVHRPWGHYDSIDKGERFQVKRIVVKPGAQLSLQMHHHRAEHWIVVRGTALVTRGEEQLILSENESVYIPLGTTHRLENPGRMPLEIIEVQSGSYLGEDDIVRFEDTYGRH